jgi:hypothetical protein
MKNGTAGTFYYSTTLDAIGSDGDTLVTRDALARKVGSLGIFSHWPGTVTCCASSNGSRWAGGERMDAEWQHPSAPLCHAKFYRTSSDDNLNGIQSAPLSRSSI